MLYLAFTVNFHAWTRWYTFFQNSSDHISERGKHCRSNSDKAPWSHSSSSSPLPDEQQKPQTARNLLSAPARGPGNKTEEGKRENHGPRGTGLVSSLQKGTSERKNKKRSSVTTDSVSGQVSIAFICLTEETESPGDPDTSTSLSADSLLVLVIVVKLPLPGFTLS